MSVDGLTSVASSFGPKETLDRLESPEMLHALLTERTTLPLPLDADLAASYQRVHGEHVDIVEALAAGDASLARLRMVRHLEHTGALAREQRDRSPSNPASG